MIKEFIIISSNTTRSVEYLKELKINKIIPKMIIHLDDNSKNNNYYTLLKNKFFFPKVRKKIFFRKKISKNICNFILKNKYKYIIFSSYSDDIIKDKVLLKKKKVIHFHPGKLPNYKGSTVLYYALLNENQIYCSTIIMNSKIDGGKILLIKKYKKPKKIFDIDDKYDAKIRSKNLIETLKQKKIKKIVNIPSNHYYIIHPVLRSLVFKKRKN